MKSPPERGKDATIAAAKSSFSRATGYRIEHDPRLPSQKKAPVADGGRSHLDDQSFDAGLLKGRYLRQARRAPSFPPQAAP
jgi:hypothetical protein